MQGLTNATFELLLQQLKEIHYSYQKVSKRTTIEQFCSKHIPKHYYSPIISRSLEKKIVAKNSDACLSDIDILQHMFKAIQLHAIAIRNDAKVGIRQREDRVKDKFASFTYSELTSYNSCTKMLSAISFTISILKEREEKKKERSDNNA